MAKDPAEKMYCSRTMAQGNILPVRGIQLEKTEINIIRIVLLLCYIINMYSYSKKSLANNPQPSLQPTQTDIGSPLLVKSTGAV